MKHSQWLTRQKEGEQIVTALTALGYRCFQPTPSLFWTVRQEEIFYRLTWLSSPLNEWSLLPNDGTKERERLLAKILAVVKQYREESFRGAEGAGGAEINLEERSPRASLNEKRSLQEHYPWSIIQLLPNARHYVVARFYNRVDAEDHQRFLSRFIPKTQFEVVFDPRSDG